MMNERPLEHCFNCDDLTGRAGKSDDSLYCDGCDTGPYCPECWKLHHAADKENAKLLQAVNDKDTELFESQELVAELLDALRKILKLIPPSGIAHEIATEAIREAKEK